jgi:hypothetical protein
LVAVTILAVIVEVEMEEKLVVYVVCEVITVSTQTDDGVMVSLLVVEVTVDSYISSAVVLMWS